MSEQNKITARTWIPLGAIVIVIIAAMFIGGLVSKVDALVDKDSPSRDEYNKLCETTSAINGKLDTLILHFGLEPKVPTNNYK